MSTPSDPRTESSETPPRETGQGCTVDEYEALRENRNMWRSFARDSADIIGALHDYTGIDGEASAAQIIERIQTLADYTDRAALPLTVTARETIRSALKGARGLALDSGEPDLDAELGRAIDLLDALDATRKLADEGLAGQSIDITDPKEAAYLADPWFSDPARIADEGLRADPATSDPTLAEMLLTALADLDAVVEETK